MIENYFQKEYISGEKLVGDQFSINDISQWYKEEEEAYAALIQHDYGYYLYENINNFYGLENVIKKINNKNLNILCFGAAFGGEVESIEKLLKFI